MYICKVVGKVVATIKNDKLTGVSLVMVRNVSLSKDGKETLGPEIFVAADSIGCGEGNLVLVTGGSNARFACCMPEAPVDMAVVGILDRGIDVKKSDDVQQSAK